MSLNSNGANKIEKYELKLESLLLYDWFLIEIGKYLISSSDLDLKNILCLNKKINEKATIVFKHHFLNFELQKQIAQLAQQEKFIQIQDLFQNNQLSLNPNSFFTYPTNSQKCFHDKNVIQYCFSPPECDCGFPNPVHLILFATRNRLNFLARLILFHPRFDPTFFSQQAANEIFNWACSEGELKALRLLLKHGNSEFNHYSIGDFELAYGFASAMIYQREEILIEFTKDLEFFSNISLIYDQLYPHLDLAKKFGGLKFYELILKSPQCNIDNSVSVLMNAHSYGPDFVVVVVKELFRRHLARDLSGLPTSIVGSLFQILVSRKNQDSEMLRLTVLFALNMPSLELHAIQLFNETKWTNDDLIYFLQNSTISKTDVLKLILSRLSRDFEITQDHINSLLERYIHFEFFACFSLIWNESRVVKTSSWTNKLLMKTIHFDGEQFMEYLISFCNLDETMEFNLMKTKNQPGLKVRTNVRNCLWLRAVETNIINDKATMLIETCGVVITEELFEWSLKIATQTNLSNSLSWILYFDHFPTQWWTKDRIQRALICGCLIGDENILKEIVASFLDFDFSFNKNECLKTICENGYFEILFPILESKFYFQDEAERNEIMEFAFQKSQFFQFKFDALSNIKIKN